MSGEDRLGNENRLEAMIALAIHDLTTGVVHKKRVLEGEPDDCLVIAQAIMARLRVESEVPA